MQDKLQREFEELQAKKRELETLLANEQGEIKEMERTLAGMGVDIKNVADEIEDLNNKKTDIASIIVERMGKVNELLAGTDKSTE